MVEIQSVTSLPLSPEGERRSRVLKYTVAMAVRMVCIITMLFVSGPLLWLCALGAVFLPYFAVVIANQHSDRLTRGRVAPGSPALAPAVRVARSDWAIPNQHNRPEN